MRDQTILLVGHRRRAFEAAKALGLRTICLNDTSPKRHSAALVDDFIPCERLDNRGKRWSRLAKGLAERVRSSGSCVAVFVLSERAVVPAAHLRRALGLPGPSIELARRCTDKLLMKRRIRNCGLPCTPFIAASEEPSPVELIDRLGLPMVVKSRIGSGGRGNRVYRHADEVQPLDRGWMAEAFVDGVEMSLEGLVRDGRTLFLNPTEYFRVRWANIVPATLRPEDLLAVTDFHQRVVEALGIETALTHLEIFLTPSGPIFSEIAIRPPGGRVTDLIELTYGFDLWKTWMQLGLGETIEPRPTAFQAAGVWILHPGPGRIARVHGVEEAREFPGVERVQISARPGMMVGERIGSGQEVGHFVVAGPTRDEVARRLLAVHEAIEITLDD